MLCFILSAFFSGSEVALFSLDRKKIKITFSNYPLIQGYLVGLLEHPRRLLVSLLIGNTFVNVTASIVAVSLSLELVESFGYSRNLILTIQIVVLTFLILIFGEITPKIWASKDPISFSKIIAIPMHWVNVIIFPVSETITEGIKFFASKLKLDKKNPPLNQMK